MPRGSNSSLPQAGALILPGLEDYLDRVKTEAAGLTDADLDRRYPESTGEDIKAANPRLYAAAARLFFQFGLSAREVAVACGLARNTVLAIIDAERPSSASVVQRQARVRRLKALSTRALAVLDGMLADSAQVRKAGPAAIANIYRMLSDKADALEADLAKVTVEPDLPPPPSDVSHYLGGPNE